MTEKQFIKKIKSLHKRNKEMIEKKALFLFKCGGVDTDKYKDDFELPKIILNAIFLDISCEYRPLSTEARRTAHNLKYF